MRLIMYNNALVSFAAQTNVCSIQIMKKIGLKRDSDRDCTHHKLAADNPLSKNILYRLSVDEYFHQAQETI